MKALATFWRWALLGLITLVLLEVALQVLALGVWLFYPDHSVEVDPDSRVAICIGDSFTFGMGARAVDGTYPAQLERILRERCDDEFRVVNLGAPGRNSRQVLARLDAEIDRWQPELVYVIVGVNDSWSKPDELRLGDPSSAADEEGFRWELRTLRLLATFGSLFPYADAPELEADPRVVGRWRSDEAGTVEFRDDGSGSYRGQEIRWIVDADHLVVALEDGAPQFAARIEVAEEGDALDLHVDGAPAPIRLLRSGTGSGDFDAEWLLEEARSALAREDFAGAVERARALAEGAAEQPEMRAAGLGILVVACAGLDDSTGRDEALTSLRACRRDDPSPVVSVALIHALRVLHLDDEATEVALADVQRFSADAMLWRELALLQLSAGQVDAARVSIERAMAAADGVAEPWLIWLARFQVYREVDIEEAARSLIRASALGLDERYLRQWFAVLSRKLELPRLRQLLDEGGLEPATRQQIEMIIGDAEDAVVTAASTAGVLASHLRQIVERCRGLGAQVAFASYPWGGSAWYYEVAAEVAATEQVAWIDLAPAFAARERERPEEELFAPDGHCNDAGYRLMAEVIAEHALQIVGDEPR